MQILGFVSFYGLIYCLGFILLIFIKVPFAKPTLLIERLNFAIYTSILAIIGARIFYIIFYEPIFYFYNFKEAFLLYKGGMSLHGAYIGCLLALILSNRKKLWSNADKLAITALICLPLGRIANFLNGEIYGTITNPSIGFIFLGADYHYRHAVTLYEAFLVGPILGGLIYFLYKIRYLKKCGDISIAFILGYFIIRIALECIREPDKTVGYILHYFTQGQILSMLCLIITIIFIKKFKVLR